MAGGTRRLAFRASRQEMVGDIERATWQCKERIRLDPGQSHARYNEVEDFYIPRQTPRSLPSPLESIRPPCRRNCRRRHHCVRPHHISLAPVVIDIAIML